MSLNTISSKTTAAGDDASGHDDVTEFRDHVMASRLHVIVHGPDNSWAIDDTVRYLRHLETLWSRFIPTSDISRINQVPGTPVRVSPETITLIERIVSAWSSTDGLFDPTILPIIIDHGYATSRVDPSMTTTLPATTMTAARSGRITSLADVHIDARASTVTTPVGMALDPAGIGKGLASDMAVERLIRSGNMGAMVSIGGDLRMDGVPPDSGGWLVDIEYPVRRREPLTTLMVDRGGVATSSTVSRTWKQDGQRCHHVIDPATGRQSVTDLATVTVFARAGWQAEAMATAAILKGSRSVIDHLEEHELSGLAVTGDGTVIATRDIRELVGAS